MTFKKDFISTTAQHKLSSTTMQALLAHVSLRLAYLLCKVHAADTGSDHDSQFMYQGGSAPLWQQPLHACG